MPCSTPQCQIVYLIQARWGAKPPTLMAIGMPKKWCHRERTRKVAPRELKLMRVISSKQRARHGQLIQTGYRWAARTVLRRYLAAADSRCPGGQQTTGASVGLGLSQRRQAAKHKATASSPFRQQDGFPTPEPYCCFTHTLVAFMHIHAWNAMLKYIHFSCF